MENDASEGRVPTATERGGNIAGVKGQDCGPFTKRHRSLNDVIQHIVQSIGIRVGRNFDASN